jgi:hypothetical protein
MICFQVNRGGRILRPNLFRQMPPRERGPVVLAGPISASLRVPPVGPFPTGKPDRGPWHLHAPQICLRLRPPLRVDSNNFQTIGSAFDARKAL